MIGEATDGVGAAGVFDATRGRIALWLGPLAFLAILAAPTSLAPPAQRLAAVMALVMVFWIGEPVPLPVTSLLGPALAVLLGVAGAREAFAPFGDPVIFLFLGSFLLGGLTFFCWAITANAWLDSSPPTMKPVTIDERVQVTHKALFRQYEIKYHFLDDPATKHDFLSSPAHMDTFDGPLGLAEVHDGRFGWPWVKEIRPLPHRQAPAGPPGP